jgi:hypothetical protein
MATRKRKLSTPKLPMQRQFAFQEKGRFFDLRKVFDKLNGRYFRNQLRGYTIMWGRKRKQLDRAFVPSWFLEYVVYHEMCHAVVPDEFDERGRRIVHHEKFYARERQFHWFRRAKQWEDENLARFLR